MKKIIGAFALASLALGLASADVKFSLNYRTQMVGFSRLIAAPNTDDYTDENVNYWFQQPKGWNSASDTVSMSASNDFAGVTVRIDPNLDKDATSSIETVLNQFNGYVRFAGFELGAGSWKDGRYNGDYQVKNDNDAGWYNGDLYAPVKLGSLYGGAITTAVDNMSDFKGAERASSAYLQWKGDLGSAQVTAEADLIGIGSDTWDDNSTIYTGFGARANIAFDSWQAQFVFKTASNKDKTAVPRSGEERALGLYFNPKTLPVNLVVGGALGFKGGDLTEWNADLRLRKVAGNLGITFYTNVSHISNECDYLDVDRDETKTLHKTPLGATYLNSKGAIKRVAMGRPSSGQNYATHMWNMLGLRLKFTDSLYFLFTAGAYTSLHHMLQDEWTGIEAFAAPGIQIMNGMCGIAAYARFGMSNIGVKDYTKSPSENELALLIPVVLRVRF